MTEATMEPKTEKRGRKKGSKNKAPRLPRVRAGAGDRARALIEKANEMLAAERKRNGLRFAKLLDRAASTLCAASEVALDATVCDSTLRLASELRLTAQQALKDIEADSAIEGAEQGIS
jgi:hypothetical protein